MTDWATEYSLLDQAEMTSILSKVHSLLLLSLIWSDGDLILAGAARACTFCHVLEGCCVQKGGLWVYSEGVQQDDGVVKGRRRRSVQHETVKKQGRTCLQFLKQHTSLLQTPQWCASVAQVLRRSDIKSRAQGLAQECVKVGSFVLHTDCT